VRERHHLFESNFSRNSILDGKAESVFVVASGFDPPIEYFLGGKTLTYYADVGWNAERQRLVWQCMQVEVKAVSRASGSPPLTPSPYR